MKAKDANTTLFFVRASVESVPPLPMVATTSVGLIEIGEQAI